MDPQTVDEYDDYGDTFGIDIVCEMIGIMLCAFAMIASFTGGSSVLLTLSGLGLYLFGSSLNASVREWLRRRYPDKANEGLEGTGLEQTVSAARRTGAKE